MAAARPADWLDRRLDLEPGDRLVFVLMCGQILCLMLAYTIAKVLRDSLFISTYGARALPWGYLGVAVAAVGLVALEGRLVRHLTTKQVADIAQYFAIAMSVGVALLAPAEPNWLAAAFYVWTGSQAILLISHVWIAALDAWDSQRARRIFPLLTGFGLLGGISGGAIAGVGVLHVGTVGLLWLVAGLLLALRVLSAWLSSLLPERPLVAQVAAGTSYWRTFRESTFLRHLALAGCLAVVVSTLVDFQFKALAQEAFPAPDDLTAFLGRFYAGLNALALVFQFGLAAWILRRIGLGPASGLQPGSMILFGIGLALAPIWPLAQAMRWVQGIVFQTLGKSSTEIYFMAIRPPERRQVKPVLDVVVERGADALAGALLLGTFLVLGVDVRIVAGLTAVIAVLWVIVLFRLHRRYVRAFRESLAAPWADPDTALQSLRVPGAIAALDEAIRSPDPRQASIALRFAARARRARLAPAVRGALDHESARVRAEAVRAATVLGLAGEDEKVRAFLDGDATEPQKRVALEYLLTHGRDAARFAHELVDGADPSLRDAALDLMAEKPPLAHGALTLEWVDRRIETGTAEALRDACRGLGHLPGAEAGKRLRLLLAHRDREVRRVALAALARRADPGLLDVALDHLNDRGLRESALGAIVAYRALAVPRLALLTRESTDEEVRSLASAALGRIATPAARRVLRDMAKSGDPSLRYHGLRNLNRVRLHSGRRQASRRDALRMFLREIRDYRGHRELAWSVPESEDPAVDLLRASYVESADRALARACRALGCYHWPVPLEGAYEGLRSGSGREAASRALEYLGSLLPGRVFQAVRTILEARPEDAPPADLAAVIEKSLESNDPWIRAAASRASREAVDVTEPAPRDAAERRLMTEVEKVIYLRGIDLFKQAGPRQLLALAARVREAAMWKGQVIYQEVDPADALYVVVEGRVRLAAGDKVLAEIGSGEAFGTWALVDDAARGQRADALEDGQLLALDREDFYDFAAGDAQLLKELVRVLAGRLKELVAERPDEARVEGEGAATPEAEADEAASG
jgi:AAA family ATP:ADP antiporter